MVPGRGLRTLGATTDAGKLGGMTGMPATLSALQESRAKTGNLDAQVHETHTGIVLLVGDKAYKAKKPLTTDFLDFSTPERRERACEHEVALNRRLAPDSYLGVGHFSGPAGGPAEPVIVMRRYPDSTRVWHRSSGTNEPVHRSPLRDRRDTGALPRGAAGVVRSSRGEVGAISARWQQNLLELERSGGHSSA